MYPLKIVDKYWEIITIEMSKRIFRLYINDKASISRNEHSLQRQLVGLFFAQIRMVKSVCDPEENMNFMHIQVTKL